ncbi:MAG: hypothetical protein CMI68_00710 [Candidatus Pelagibacter sp.]|nr:hypothetical protein [Candidatus Pelagibacter sp.]
MKKLFGNNKFIKLTFKIVILSLFLCSKTIGAIKPERIIPIYYNEPTKRIYILGTLEDEKDHLFFSRYVNDGAKSVFVNFSGGYGGPQIAPIIIKKKLPVFAGRFCFSTCAVISLSSPTLYASKKTIFLIHDSRAQPGYTIQDSKFSQKTLDKFLINAGANEKFMKKLKIERDKDISRFKTDWVIHLTCNDAKKYFTKNEIFCDTVNTPEGVKFILENNPNIKNVYCSNDDKKQIIEVLFSPSCPKGYQTIKKTQFNELKKNYNLIEEDQPGLSYVYDYGKLDTLIHELGKLGEAGIDFNFDEISKKHGFKSFKDAVKEYKKRFDYKISVKDAIDYFEKVDLSIEINYSQNNLDRLYKNLINNKIVKRRSKYFKTKPTEHYPYKALSACINLRKVLAKLTIDPKSKSPRVYVWGMAEGKTKQSIIDGAIMDNQLWRIRAKAPSCDYIVFDVNDQNNLTEDYINEYIKYNF